MRLKSLVPVLWTGVAVSATGQTLLDDVDAARFTAAYHGEMGFDDGGGMTVERYQLRALLSHPIRPVSDLVLLPVFTYEQTRLDFDRAPAGQPFGDEDLHLLSVKTSARYTPAGSPWEVSGSLTANFATDFEHLDGDDVTFDAIAQVGYRWREDLLVGFGVGVLEINGALEVWPGPVVEYTPSESFAAGLHGPNFQVIAVPNERWEFSLKGNLNGGEWNVEGAGGESRTIDFNSYRVGLYADRHLFGEVWLSAGAGVTLFNNIKYTETNGHRIYREDLDSGWFGQIALRVKTW
ncbi:MAG: DUF6268 family outer membrane beta-barrel protein [Luteolibacter sp.]